MVYSTSTNNYDKCNMRVSSVSDTTITDADTYYQVAGTFADGECKNFTVSSSGTITYVGVSGRNFLLVGVSDLDVDKVCTITYALEKNDVIQTDAVTPHTFLAPSKTSNISITRIISLNNGDVLKIKAKSSEASTTLYAKTLFISLMGEN